MYLVFSPVGMALADPSQRRVLFSAVIAALDISHRDMPIFLSSEPIGYTRHAKELLGYHILGPRLSDHEASLQTAGDPAVGHFESSVLAPVTRKHSLYYLDGLVRLFGAKVWKFSYGTLNVSEEQLALSSWETYNYQPHYSGGGQQGQEGGDRWATPPSHSPALTPTNSFARRPEATPEEVVRALAGAGKGATARLPPALQSTLEDLQACFPDSHDPYTLSATDLPLWKLSVQLHFAAMKQSAVVDNDYYTTLLPSKLPPAAFSASAEFSNAYKAPVAPTAHELMSEPSIAPVYSSSLRRLLAMYVCGKSCKPGHTFRSLSGKDGPVSVLNTDKAINISSILSTDSRRVVVAMCAALGGGADEESAAASVSMSQDLLMRVFSRSLWVDDGADPTDGLYEDHFGVEGVRTVGSSDDDDESGFFDCDQSPTVARQPPFGFEKAEPMSCELRRTSTESVASRWRENGSYTLPWKWLSKSDIVASPVGSWLSLVSVYVSSLTDIRSMTSFWVECVEEVRVHWENRVPIPRLFPAVPIASSSSSSSLCRRGKEQDGGRSDSLRNALRRGGQWVDPLWRDVIDRLRCTATPFMLPDTSQCLPFQKLQVHWLILVIVVITSYVFG